MLSSRLNLIASLLLLACSPLQACGIAVHNEVTYRAIENFQPKTLIEQLYKEDMLLSASYSQAGSFFPDWGYQCLGYNQQSEDAHWPTFIKTAVNYIRRVYPASLFHSDSHVQGLISFVFAIMSHGIADVKWHSLSGLQDYFVVAMAKSDFHGDTTESHLAADTGAEFTLRHSNTLSYLNETWQVPIKDIVEIYKLLYINQKDKKVPQEGHIQYCMAAAFAASKVDVAFGQYMWGIYGSKSPFLTEELYDYPKGGIQDMSAGVSDCYPELVQAFEDGVNHTVPDSLCADYFYSSLPFSSPCHVPRLRHKNHSKNKSHVYQYYDRVTGVLILTAKNMYKQQQQQHTDDELPSVDVIVPQRHEEKENVRFQVQSPLSQKLKIENDNNNDCFSLEEEDAITFSLPVPSAKLGHQVISGDFNGDGQLDTAFSAPYDDKTGTVFILNNSAFTASVDDIRSISSTQLKGTVPHERFGWSLASIDMDHDGIDDLIVASLSGILVQFGQKNIGLGDRQKKFQTQELGTVLTGIDIDGDGFKDLVIGSPLSSKDDQPQVGNVYIYKSDPYQQYTKPDMVIENPNKQAYDHFGESVLRVKDTLLIGAPGYSTENEQRVGRVYAFDLQSGTLKWFISGKSEFQQFGRVIATDNENEFIAISSPSEENTILFKKYWQGGTVRIYNWDKLDQSENKEVDMEYGLSSIIQGRSNAGHLGQSISFYGNRDDIGVWIGEPMSEKENGRIYRWKINTRDNIQCIRNNQALLARFGSQIGPALTMNTICITSQRYGQNARHSGAVTFLRREENIASN